MDPQLLRGAFRIGFLLLAVAVVTLPFQPAGSAERVVTILAAIVAIAFLVSVAVLARISEPRLPDDKDAGKGYKWRSTRRGR